jgi:outer membrane protein OmpA-like peptidoglycan-associated protein
MNMNVYPIQSLWTTCKGIWLRYGHLVHLAALAIILPAALPAQAPHYSIPSWWWGVAAGANVNFYGGSTDNLNAAVDVPTPFHRALGLGLYAAPLLEYRPANSYWGGMLQIGYDSRRAQYEQETAPCNCPSDLSVELGYVSIEPSLRFAPFKSSLYFYLGPRIAYNVQKSFLLEQISDPNDPGGAEYADKLGDFSDVRTTIFSGQIGAGYDIAFQPGMHRTQWVLSPFVAYHPYFGQDPRSVGLWTNSALRAGVALKMGRGKLLPVTEVLDIVPMPAAAIPPVYFTANAPGQIPDTRQVNEIFPLRNYVFFDSGATEIPARYVRLRPGQVKDFQEAQIGMPYSSEALGRSHRQLVVYYNVLNILGDRMRTQPSTKIRLVGSSEDGQDDALAMAGAVERYLVQVFAIDGSRITVEGRLRPEIASGQAGGHRERALLRAGNRRVSIESDSPDLLMEFQRGPTALMKPIQLRDVAVPPLESYVNFNAEGADDAFMSWRMEITDAAGKVQTYGPYTRERVSIPGKTILGRNAVGDYHVVMVGETPSHQVVRKSTDMHLALWTPAVDEEVMRFSVLYEFDDAKTPEMYVQYLTEIVAPKISAGSKVMVHGYTDVIGEEPYNRALSLARAEDVRQILQKALAKAGREGVTIETYGFGEDPFMTQFENDYPEERFYNRSVLIDIVDGM